MKYKLDIIIPVYNEDKIILDLLSNIDRNISFSFRILICYDHAKDTTLNKILNSNLNLKNIVFVKNKSLGPNNAILTGIERSTADILLVYMVDDLINLSLINNMISLIDSGYDLIIPSRFVDGGKFIGANLFKKIITILGFISIHNIAGIPYKDCTNAFKMFKKNILTEFKLNSNIGFTYALELTIKSHYKNKKIVEIPSQWIEIEGRKSKFKIFTWLPHYLYWFCYAVLLNMKIIKL